MSSNIKKRTGSVICIDAGGEWLKMAVLDGVGSSPSISQLSLSPTDGGVDALAQVFPAAWKRMKAARKTPVIVCLPRQLVTVRMIELPSTDPAEIDDMVDLQVGKQTPYTKDEIVYDYKLVSGGREGYTTVMLAIAQRSIVRQIFYAFEEAEVEVERVTVSTEAVAGWSSRGLQGGDFRAVLDVDSFYSDFIVMRGDSILFSRSILIGADHLHDASSVGRLIKEVRSSVEVFRSEMSGGSIESIAVSGVASAAQAVAGELQSAGLKCSFRDAVKDLKRPPQGDADTLKHLKKVSLSSIVGVGAAPDALEFNLVPDSISVRRNLMEKAKSLTTLGMLLMTMLVSLSVYASIRGFTTWDSLNSMNKELVSTGVRANEVARMMDVVRQVRERKDPGRSALAVLLDIRSAVSSTGDQIKFTNIELDANAATFRIEGMADNTKDIREFRKALEESGIFKNVTESGTTSERAIKKYKFQISGQLEVAK